MWDVMKINRGVNKQQIFFAIAFLLGIILITLLAKGKKPENTIMNQALGQALLDGGWNKKELFLQCLWNRGIIFGIIIVLAYTAMRTWMFRVVVIWSGFIFGVMIKLFYLWYGIRGMGLLITAMLPQLIFYWMAYGLVYWESDRQCMCMNRNYLPLFVAIAVVIMGIILESYVNPILVNGYVKIFF